MDGIVLIDKRTEMSSHGATSIVRGVLKVKAGHSGTLDPFASGLLIVGVGRGTKVMEYLTDTHKVYEATLCLGQTSSTLDPEGEITTIEEVTAPTSDEITSVLSGFEGQIMQVPPLHSALKVNGIKSYELARKGHEVHHDPRQVQIAKIEVISYDYPDLKIRVTCGKGTYIRSLARDIGTSLGCGAYVTALRRTENAGYKVEDASDIFSGVEKTALLEAYHPLHELVLDLPIIEVDDSQRAYVAYGRPFDVSRPMGIYQLRDSKLGLVGVVHLTDQGMKYQKVFITAADL